MKKYVAFFKIEFIHFFEYRSEFVASFISTFIQLFVLIFFSIAIFENNEQVYGYTLSSFATYNLLSVLIGKIVETDVNWVIQEQIRKGSLSNLLVKPIKYNIQRFFGELSWKVHSIFYSLIVLSFITVIYSSIFDLEILYSKLPIFIFALVLSFFLNRSFRYIIGCLAFWTKDIGGISNFANEVINIMGGKWLPLEFFGIFSVVFKLLPFSYIYYFPIRIITDPTLTSKETVTIILIMLLWTVLFNIVAVFFWRKGLKRYESVGN